MPDQDSVVVLVEDNEDHAELIKRILSEQVSPLRLIHLTDGQAVLDYLNREIPYTDPLSSPRPHLILLDLRLPKIDGLEIVRIIKRSKTLRSIPVVILTTSTAERDISRAYDNYVNSYLVKPVGFEQFRELLEELRSYWLDWNTYSY
jgi:CheY-like chemotaxis protein